MRPVAQVGLLAPFEGTSRRTGYAALEAVRAAILEAPPQTGALVPLALDTSLDGLRAAQKMAVLPAVQAVLGPLTVQEMTAAAPALRSRDLVWISPYAAGQAGFAAPDDPVWLGELVQRFAVAAGEAGAQGLAVAGWAEADRWFAGAGLGAELAIRSVRTAADVQPGEAILWLGDAAGGVNFVGEVRVLLPDTAVFLAPWAAEEVFAERYSGSLEGVFWGIWLPADAGPEAGTASAASFLSLLLRRATLEAVALETAGPAIFAPWTFQLFALAP